jgi:hypothetical protein
MEKNKILKLVEEVRDYINIPRNQHNILLAKDKWNQICSSLDVLGDTELAINAYLNNVWNDIDGTKYLMIYGLLQAIYIQQDALKHIAEALDIKVDLTDDLKEIREIRNDSIGHPTKRTKSKNKSFHFISRMTMNKGGFTLLSYSDGIDLSRYVNLTNIIKQQYTSAQNLLSDIITELHSREQQHKNNFNHMKLVNIFPQTMSYHLSKVIEGINNGEPYRSIGFVNIKYISDLYEKVKSELKERKEFLTGDMLEYQFEKIDYPIKELIKYFESQDSVRLNKKDADIFAHFIKSHHQENILPILEELDDEYTNTNN